MISWAILSALMIFVQTPTQFYVLRFLLGVAEAGFFPGIVFYLTLWFPSWRSARTLGLFILVTPLSTIIGSPLSGFILKFFDGVDGLHNWQWLFVVEAIPSFLLAFVVLRQMGLSGLVFGLLVACGGVASLVGATAAPVVGRRLGTGRAILATRSLVAPSMISRTARLWPPAQ